MGGRWLRLAPPPGQEVYLELPRSRPSNPTAFAAGSRTSFRQASGGHILAPPQPKVLIPRHLDPTHERRRDARGVGGYRTTRRGDEGSQDEEGEEKETTTIDSLGRGGRIGQAPFPVSNEGLERVPARTADHAAQQPRPATATASTGDSFKDSPNGAGGSYRESSSQARGSKRHSGQAQASPAVAESTQASIATRHRRPASFSPVRAQEMLSNLAGLLPAPLRAAEPSSTRASGAAEDDSVQEHTHRPTSRPRVNPVGADPRAEASFDSDQHFTATTAAGGPGSNHNNSGMLQGPRNEGEQSQGGSVGVDTSQKGASASYVHPPGSSHFAAGRVHQCNAGGVPEHVGVDEEGRPDETMNEDATRARHSLPECGYRQAPSRAEDNKRARSQALSRS